MDHLFGIAPILAMFAMFHYLNPERVRYWLWTKVVPIAAIRPSRTVRVTGTVEALDEVLDAPVSGRPCVHYVASVAEDADEKGKWIELHSVQRSVDFVVRDETGAVLIRLDGATIEAETTCTTRSNALGAPSAKESAFLQRFGEAPTGAHGFCRALRFTEAALKVGDVVTVRGEARRGSGRLPTLLVAPPRSGLWFVSTARGWLRIADARPGVSTSKSYEL